MDSRDTCDVIDMETKPGRESAMSDLEAYLIERCDLWFKTLKPEFEEKRIKFHNSNQVFRDAAGDVLAILQTMKAAQSQEFRAEKNEIPREGSVAPQKPPKPAKPAISKTPSRIKISKKPSRNESKHKISS